jgi:hypothetical protein
MSLLTDPFDGMPDGQSAGPNGWSYSGNGGIVFDYGTQAPFSNIGGLWPGHKYWWSQNGTDVITPLWGPTTSASIFTGYQILANNNTPVDPLFSVLTLGNGLPGQNKNFNGAYTFDILDVRQEQDLTFSIWTPGGVDIAPQLLDNSGNPIYNLPDGGAFPINTWYYIDLELSTVYIEYNGITYVSVGAELYIDGVMICDSVNHPPLPNGSPPIGLTGVEKDSLANPLSPTFSFVQYNNNGGSNYCLSQYDIESGNSGGQPPALTTLPSQSPPNLVPLMSNVKVSQLPVELLTNPPAPNTRITQLPIEVAVRPYTPNVRISQLVIELAHQSAPLPPGGWQVKEI